MENFELKVAVMIGSIRKDRQSIKPAEVIVGLLKERHIDPIVLDLQELNLPVFDDGLESASRTTLLETYKKMDGLILVTPEYNHGIPGCVKNAIDFARNGELKDKPMTLVTVSNGGWGGIRAVDHIRQCWFGNAGLALRHNLQTRNVKEFDAENPDAAWLRLANNFIEDSLRWFRVIKTGTAQEK